MKYSWLNWRKVVLDDRDLSFGAKSMALYLNTYMNDSHDMAFPSIETIRGELSIGSSTTVIKYLTELTDAKYLKKRKRFNATCVYMAILPPSITESVKLEIINDLQDAPVLQNLEHSITESVKPVLQNLESNNQDNNQSNKQKSAFASFWKLYPKKRDKKKAEVAFKRNKCGDELDLILNALKKQISSSDWRDIQYIPLPTTYINGARWEDEISVRATSGSDWI